MADEYIRKQDAVHTIMGQPPDAHYPSWYAAQIEAIPAADVVPVVHGRWIDADFCGQYECSECGNNAVDLYDYCPFCGAKMDGGENG